MRSVLLSTSPARTRAPRRPTAVAVAMMLALLGACGDDGTNDAEEPVTADVDTEDATAEEATSEDANAEDAEEASEEPSADGLMGAGEIPDGYPEDIPLPDDYEVTSAFGNPETGFTITLETPATVEELVELYESGLADAGWSDISVNVRDTGDGTSAEVTATAPDPAVGGLGASFTGGDGPTGVQLITGPPPS